MIETKYRAEAAEQLSSQAFLRNKEFVDVILADHNLWIEKVSGGVCLPDFK